MASTNSSYPHFQGYVLQRMALPTALAHILSFLTKETKLRHPYPSSLVSLLQPIDTTKNCFSFLYSHFILTPFADRRQKYTNSFPIHLPCHTHLTIFTVLLTLVTPPAHCRVQLPIHWLQSRNFL